MTDDLLAAVERGELSVDEAQTEIEAYIDSVHRGEANPDWPAALGLSEAEATAYAHGAGIHLMLELRRAGPTIACGRCGVLINIHDTAWMVDLGPSARPALVHVECPIATARAH